MWKQARQIKYPLLVLLAGIVALWAYSAFPSEGNITFSPDRNLIWRDFKQVKTINNRPGINARAITYVEPKISRTIEREDHLKVIPEIEVGIDEERTQVSLGFLARADKEKKEVVLNHENGHYKIARIIGKRIFRAASAFDFHRDNYQAQFDSLVRANFEEWQNLDRSYDRKTTNPRNLEKQKEWDRYFREELSALE
jgi:hypothetical protein